MNSYKKGSVIMMLRMAEKVKESWLVEAYLKSFIWKDNALKMEFVSSRIRRVPSAFSFPPGDQSPIVGEFTRKVIKTFNPGYNLDALFFEVQYSQKIATEEFVKRIAKKFLEV